MNGDDLTAVVELLMQVVRADTSGLLRELLDDAHAHPLPDVRRIAIEQLVDDMNAAKEGRL